MNLQDKIVLITGASRGIGAAIAKKFAAEGAFVVINYLKNHSLAEAVVTEIESMGGQGAAIQADVRNADHVNEMMDKSLMNLVVLM